MVPVVRDADRLTLAEIEKAIADLGKRARDGKLAIEDMQGGTFTITNGGVYGSLMSTPILNPPQSGILGMHRIEERPVVRGGQIVARPMMYLALSYDHRIVDGKEAVTFLVRVKEALEDPDPAGAGRLGPAAVPIVARIGGARIEFYFNEHPPAHFHAVGGGQKVQIDIETLVVMHGHMEPDKLRRVLTWAAENRPLLMAAWQRAREFQDPREKP